MRNDFFPILHKLMGEDSTIVVLTGDLGYGGFDRIREDFSDRFINVGAAEQAMMDIAVGLSYAGKTPVCYSITPFLLYRPFETWRTYIDHEKLHVIGIGSGRDNDYTHDGFSHYAGDDYLFMQQFREVKSVWPPTTEKMERTLRKALYSSSPWYINLKK